MRNTKNYDEGHLYADHEDSVAMWMKDREDYVMPTVDEQVEEAEENLDETLVEE